MNLPFSLFHCKANEYVMFAFKVHPSYTAFPKMGLRRGYPGGVHPGQVASSSANIERKQSFTLSFIHLKFGLKIISLLEYKKMCLLTFL